MFGQRFVLSLVVIKIEKLTKRYGKNVAVDNLSLDIDGQIYGLLGSNGAGKTTTLRLLATLLEPTSGTATVAGFDIKKQSRQVRYSIGLVNSGMGLYDRLTGREILHYFAGFYGLNHIKIEKRIEELDDMLDLSEVLDRKAKEYSSGMKQKILIARAVMHNPPILIFDEATNGLDVIARRSVLDFIKTYRKPGKLVLYSTHLMNEAEELCDKAAIINKGKLLVEGKITDLKIKMNAQTLEEAFFRTVHSQGELYV